MAVFLVLLAYAQDDGEIFQNTGRNKAPGETSEEYQNVIPTG